MFPSPPDATAIRRLHAQARREARRLRRAAVGNLWKAVAAGCQHGLAACHAWVQRRAARFINRIKKV